MGRDFFKCFKIAFFPHNPLWFFSLPRLQNKLGEKDKTIFDTLSIRCNKSLPPYIIFFFVVLFTCIPSQKKNYCWRYKYRW